MSPMSANVTRIMFRKKHILYKEYKMYVNDNEQQKKILDRRNLNIVGNVMVKVQSKQ